MMVEIIGGLAANSLAIITDAVARLESSPASSPEAMTMWSPLCACWKGENAPSKNMMPVEKDFIFWFWTKLEARSQAC